MDNIKNNTMENTKDNTIDTKIIYNHDSCKYNECIVKNNKNIKVQYCSGNFCVSCGENLGDSNPRQLCRKTYCPYEK